MRMSGRLAAAAVISLTLIGSALAHTQLTASNPADQAMLETSPESITLSFSEAVRLTAVTVESGSESQSLELAAGEPAAEFSVALPTLEPGDYVVQWRAVSADTHVITGEIRFSIAS